MTNSKKYNFLYFISLLVTCIFAIITGVFMDDVAILFVGPLYVSFLFIINLILCLIFIILSRKYKLKKSNIIIPILYLAFLIIIFSLSIVMNYLLIVPNIHFSYYYNLILIGYLMLNIYSLLCLSKWFYIDLILYFIYNIFVKRGQIWLTKMKLKIKWVRLLKL